MSEEYGLTAFREAAKEGYKLFREDKNGLWFTPLMNTCSFNLKGDHTDEVIQLAAACCLWYWDGKNPTMSSLVRDWARNRFAQNKLSDKEKIEILWRERKVSN